MVMFDEETHTYTDENGKQLISVTQLMQKHGLAPNYGDVPQAVLKRKAERGSLIHKEIEEYNHNGAIGFTRELSQYIDYTESNPIDVVASELMVCNDVVAGTTDILLYEKGEYVIADIKTTATLHREAVAWQLAIYAYLFMEHNKTIKITRGKAFWFDGYGNLNVVEIPLKAFEDVERLIECERSGNPFKPQPSKFDEKLKELARLKSLTNYYDAEANKIAEELKEHLRSTGEKSLSNELISVTYKTGATKSTFDSKAFKEDNPVLYATYDKESTTKDSVLIKLKETKE